MAAQRPPAPTGVNPNPPSVSQRWWVINKPTQGGGRGVPFTQYFAVIATSKPGNAVAGPFTSKNAANAWITSANTAGNSPGSAVGGAANVVGNAVGGWLSSLGGMIASGIEGAFIAIFKDLWLVIEGPILVIAGALLALMMIGWYFKNDIAQLVSLVGMAAA